MLESEDGGVVMRLPDGFLKVLGDLDEESYGSIASRWSAAAETLAEVDPNALCATLAEMAGFARTALAGPGALSIPMV